MLKLEVKPYTLDFKFSAKTSRGVIKQRDVWFIKVINSKGDHGLGEIAPIDRLSPEDPTDVIPFLEKLEKKLFLAESPVNQEEALELAAESVPINLPSVRFGLETALLDLVGGGEKIFFDSNINQLNLPVNGLIWMGEASFMQSQIKEKLDQGFDCIKLKVGSLDFDTELDIVKKLREISDQLVIRLDANGAFATNEVLMKLKHLSKYNIHSIEQPILPKQPEAMEIVCKKGAIPVAFDEELIGLDSSEERMQLIQELKPQYLVLKPTLLGGLQSINNWIDLAKMHGIDWWLTSYLESNIGLNAIAQFTAQFINHHHSGLGTGSLYNNNIQSPIKIEKGRLIYDKSIEWGNVF